MAIFSKESLESLKQKVDLVELLSSHIELKRSGSSFKGLCPFHDEKSPSFIVHKGDSHYHCFGCGAHGDAIQFLMQHLKLNFAEAVENLAERFQVKLETVEGTFENKGPNKAKLKEALDVAAHFYHFCLLHTDEGHQALQYLYSRGIDLEFIYQFKIGLAPKSSGIFRQVMKKKGFFDEVLQDAGLLSQSQTGGLRDFFFDRIVFPIHNATGDVIGFSARKYKEETFGGKYVNTSETALFKKSKVLFGLSFSRRRIAKERKAIIVEGQIDALRLIHSGFNITVAGQGTAFGDDHVKELVKLGVLQVYLAFDADGAGQQATYKVGHLFQKEGIEVRILQLPSGYDPDLFLRERGAESFLELMDKGIDYLTFLISYLSKTVNANSPAGKNELIHQAAKQIREWNHPMMVHETLRRLSHVMNIPENMIGMGVDPTSNIYIKKSASVGVQTVDPDKILEMDILRWLLLLSEEQSHLIELVKKYISVEDFRTEACRKIYQAWVNQSSSSSKPDWLSLLVETDHSESQLVFAELTQKKINIEKADLHIVETLQKILDRNWILKREEIKIRIQSGQCSDDEVISLAKQFDSLKRIQVV